MKTAEIGMAGQVFNPPIIPTVGTTSEEVIWFRIREKRLPAEFRVPDVNGLLFTACHAVPIIDDMTPR